MDGDTALHAAALSGSAATVSHLLDAGADPNAVYVMTLVAVVAVVFNGRASVSHVDDSVDDRNASMCTPLHHAAFAQAADVFQLLVFRGAVVSRPVGAGEASAAMLCPEGMELVQQSIALKEHELRNAIRSGALFASLSPARSSSSSIRPLASGPRSASAPSSMTRSGATRGQVDNVLSDSSDEERTVDIGDNSDDETGEWGGDAENDSEDAPRTDSASARAAALSSTASVMLRVVGGFEPPVFKDSPLRIRLVLTPNTQTNGTVRDVQRLLARWDGRLQISMSLEDAHGGAVNEVAKGRRSGARILNQDEVEVQVGADGALELSNVRIREVSRNHAGGAFRLVFSISGSAADMVVPAVTRPFHVLSERIRAPSYRNQISRQRERRMRRTLNSGAAAQADGLDDE